MKTDHLFAGLVVLMASTSARAHEDEDGLKTLDQLVAGVDDIAQLTLDDFLASRYELAGRTPQTVRESPGVLSIVTREEIAAIGARDLIDVLALVPGFHPTLDSESHLTVGFRGLWSNDGRHLVLIDGQEMNEMFYTGVRMNNRFPVDQIERVELIRGPGSVIYGGYAELAVINIVTRGAHEHDGASATATLGARDDGDARRTTIAASYAHRFDQADDLELSLAIYGGVAHTSGHAYTDHYGVRYRLDGPSGESQPLFANGFASYRGLSLRLIYDGYQSYQRDIFEDSAPAPYRLAERGTYAELAYAWQVTPTLRLTPSLRFKRQSPWRVADETAPDAFFMKTADRAVAALVALWQPAPAMDLVAGLEGHSDWARLDMPPSELSVGFLDDDGNPVDHARYDNIAAYAQAQIGSEWGTLVAGARAERHSEVGTSVVPRAAYTFVRDALHLKLLASQAFRAPGIENFNLVPLDASGAPLRTSAERTTVYEAELGYQPLSWLWGVVSVYDLSIADTISFSWDPETDAEGYENFERAGSRGLEAEVRLRGRHGWVTASYSFYTAAGKNRVPQYAVPATRDRDQDAALDDASAYRQDVNLGFPQHKGAVSGALELVRDVWLSGSAVTTSRRYTYGEAVFDAAGELESLRTTSEAPSVVASVFVRKDHLGTQGVSLLFGIHDVFDTDLRAVQGYDGWHPPLPMSSREFLLRLVIEP